MVTLSLEEAASYFNMGIGKIIEISNSENCPDVLWVGNKRLIKRKKLEVFLDAQSVKSSLAVRYRAGFSPG